MGSTLDGRNVKLLAKRRAKVNERAEELIAEEMSLQDLREAGNLADDLRKRKSG